MKSTPPRTELRIVHQARTPHGRTHKFACGDRRLALDFSSTAGSADTHWTVIATGRERVSGDDVSISAQGATRTDVLRAVARQWQEDSLKYPPFEWEAIETLLREVKAL